MNQSLIQRLFLPLLLLAVTAVYWPGLGGGFVFDDLSNIVANTALHVSLQSGGHAWLAAIFSSPASDLQRPLAMLTFAINHALTGLDPYWMKLTNVGIHLLNTCLVFLLARQLLRLPARGLPAERIVHADWLALWTAAAWALNPINLMAVLPVVQRMETLSHTFVLAGLWLYLVGRSGLLADGRGWSVLLAGLLGGTGLGALTKESAVLLPLYALVLEWTLLRFATLGHAKDRRLMAVFVAVLLLPAVAGLAWLLPRALQAGAYAGRNFSLGERLLTEARVVVDYLHWTLLPNLRQLSLYHDDYVVSQGLMTPPATCWSLLLLALLGTAAFLLRRRRPLTSLGLAWFLAAHLLTATVIPLELVYEHRNYFASLGLCLVLADALLLAPSAQRWRLAGIAGPLAVLALYAGLTALRAREWQNPLQFSMIEAAKHPQSPRATYDVARNFLILSNYQPDSPYTDKAFEALDRAMRVPDATPLPEAAAITLAARIRRPIPPAWWNNLQHKLRTRPIGPQQTGALAGLVACQLHQDCPLPARQMAATFDAALAQGPHAEVLSIQGNYVLNIEEDPPRAMSLWQQAAQLAPRTAQYQQTLARMLIATGQLDAASAKIARLRRLGRWGQHAHAAEELERLVAKARLEHQATTGTKRPQ